MPEQLPVDLGERWRADWEAIAESGRLHNLQPRRLTVHRDLGQYCGHQRKWNLVRALGKHLDFHATVHRPGIFSVQCR